MDINNKKQYNQGIGKYKILSSTAGVGSLVTTKWGGFIMPLSISDWQFIKTLSAEITKPENANHTLQQLGEEYTEERLRQRFGRLPIPERPFRTAW